MLSFNLTEFFDSFLKIGISCGLGFLIGFEREFHRHPGGLCTYILVSSASTLYTLVSIKMGEMNDVDTSRIAAQIVTGIGFIGAGTIYKAENYVKGINTAASLWMTASVGMAVGADMTEIAIIGSSLTTIVLFSNNLFRRGCCNSRRRRNRIRQNNENNDEYNHSEDE